MKVSLLILIAVTLAWSNLQAQDFQGSATYMTKTTMDMDFGGRQMPEAQKKMIHERMKSMLEKTFVLNFNRTTSTYEEEQKLEQPGGSAGGGMRFMGMGGASGVYFKDIQSKTYANETDIFGKPFLIEDTLQPLAWTLTAETKQIGQYTCYKATAVKPLDTIMSNMINRFRPPNQREADEKEKDPKAKVFKDSLGNNKEVGLAARISEPSETMVTAWYTLDIPISQGPKEYWGLPGLILEVIEGRTVILCSKITLNPKEKINILAPTKGKKISQAEYQETMAKKAEEMSERFRGNRSGGGNRVMIHN